MYVKKLGRSLVALDNNNNNNNNTSICEAHNVSIRAESEAPKQILLCTDIIVCGYYCIILLLCIIEAGIIVYVIA